MCCVCSLVYVFVRAGLCELNSLEVQIPYVRFSIKLKCLFHLSWVIHGCRLSTGAACVPSQSKSRDLDPGS